jgi:hypothetical protein
MKISLTLSGQLRSWKAGYEYIKKNLIDHYDVDVYFHTWSKNWDIGVVETYKPKEILVENDSVFGEYSGYRIVSSRHPARNTIMMYRSIKYADMLRRNSGVTYDWVVRTRFDFALNKKIQFHELDKQKMYFCDTRSNEDKSVVHDQFCIAVPSDMDIYTSLYDNIHQYHEEGCFVNGEDLLEHHLRKAKVVGVRAEYLDLNPPFLHGKFNYGRHSLIRDDMEKWL